MRASILALVLLGTLGATGSATATHCPGGVGADVGPLYVLDLPLVPYAGVCAYPMVVVFWGWDCARAPLGYAQAPPGCPDI